MTDIADAECSPGSVDDLPYRCRVKICGFRSAEQAAYAARAGADAIGLVFYEPSPRNINDLGLAREIAQSVGPFVEVVALVVNPDAAVLERILTEVPINAIQFHGEEAPRFCQQFHRPYLKALRMKPSLNLADAVAPYAFARGILLDSYVPGVPGGTGATFNWERIPSGMPNLVLAGGLTEDNVTDAVAQVRPYAVDVSGGVESSPGEKSFTKMAAFIRAAKQEL